MKILKIKPFLICLPMVVMLYHCVCHGCTIFVAGNDQTVLAGNNEDWKNPFAKIWFFPAEQGKYGRVYFGFDNGFHQGGMNDQGMFFDYAATRRLEVKHRNRREKYRGNLMDKVMEECATVDEALKILNRYDLSFLSRAQVLIADRNGHSVIVEGTAMLPAEKKYQVMTNFYQSTAEIDKPVCHRFETASRMLETGEITVELFRSILTATHQRGKYPTQYSNIYDLKNRIVYVYHFHNYDKALKIDLHQALLKGRHSEDLVNLFPKREPYTGYVQKYTRHSKLSPQRNPLIKAVLIFCGILFSSIILAWPISGLIGRRKSAANFQMPMAAAENYLPASAFFIGTGASVSLLILLAGLLKYPFVIDQGLPCWNDGLTGLQKFLLLTPAISTFCAVVSVIYTGFVWRKRHVSKIGKFHFTLVSGAALIMCLFLLHWDLIGFCI